MEFQRKGGRSQVRVSDRHTLIHTQQEWGTVLDRHVLHQTARTRPGTVFGK